DILFAAKKRITLIGGGSYLILQDGKIEYGTGHDYFRRTGHSVLTVPEAKPLKMPLLPGQYPLLKNKICIECLLNAIKANDAVVQGA
ncbi:type VI secretion system tip protein VgrG, partial [Rouxiella chamberiensis]